MLSHLNRLFLKGPRVPSLRYRRGFAASPTYANPLLEQHVGELPAFEAIQPTHFPPAMSELLTKFDQDFTTLESQLQNKSSALKWSQVVEEVDVCTEKLGRVWGILGHLLSVKNSNELRQIQQDLQPQVVLAFTRLSQSSILYDAYQILKKTSALDEAQERILDKAILTAKLAGVGCEEAVRERINAINLRTAELTTQFSNNVLDSTKAGSIVVTDKAVVDGLPASVLEIAAQNAKADGHEHATAEEGPWKLTLDGPCVQPVLQYASNRDLRHQLYSLFMTRSSAFTEFNNEPIIKELLELRQEQANLLGYRTFADMSLASKMAPDVTKVNELLKTLYDESIAKARSEFESLQAYAKANGQETDLKQWDVAYWSEKRRNELFSFSDEDLKPYFPLPKVLDGLFELAQRAFGIKITPQENTTSTWHPDVKFFKIENEQGELVASFYLDAYSRPEEKNGGAWFNTCLDRSKLHALPGESLRKPVAYLVCNQSRPTSAEAPSLMTFREVETLFHEFGHGLQHMLTTVDHSAAAGINGVEWDAVELPSQFMENFCYHRGTIRSISAHIETQEPLPDSLFNQVCNARQYMAASFMLRQLYLSALDLRVHSEHDVTSSTEELMKFQQRVANEYALLKPLEDDRILCSFSHIFAGGYAAGYYSYKWAEVLSCDAFEAFVDAGLDNEEAFVKTGRRFRDTVLALGGSRHPLQVFQEFRGRTYDTKPLLRSYGLLEEN